LPVSPYGGSPRQARASQCGGGSTARNPKRRSTEGDVLDSRQAVCDLLGTWRERQHRGHPSTHSVGGASSPATDFLSVATRPPATDPSTALTGSVMRRPPLPTAGQARPDKLSCAPPPLLQSRPVQPLPASLTFPSSIAALLVVSVSCCRLRHRIDGGRRKELDVRQAAWRGATGQRPCCKPPRASAHPSLPHRNDDRPGALSGYPVRDGGHG